MEEPIRRQVMTLRKRCEETVSKNWTGGFEDCDDNIIGYLTDLAGNSSKFDATLFDSDIDPLSETVKNYLRFSGKTNELYTQLHIS